MKKSDTTVFSFKMSEGYTVTTSLIDLEGNENIIDINIGAYAIDEANKQYAKLISKNEMRLSKGQKVSEDDEGDIFEMIGEIVYKGNKKTLDPFFKDVKPIHKETYIRNLGQGIYMSTLKGDDEGK